MKKLIAMLNKLSAKLTDFWNVRTSLNFLLGVIVWIVLVIRTFSSNRSTDALWIISGLIFSGALVWFIVSSKKLPGIAVGPGRKKRLIYALRYHLSSIITLVIIIVMIWPPFIDVLKKFSQIISLHKKLHDCQWLSWLDIFLHQTLLRHYTVDRYVALSWGILMSIDLCFLQHRWTYRVLPNVFTSAAFFIMYMLIVSAQLGRDTIMGMEIMTPERMAPFISDSFTKWLGWGVVGAFVTTFVGKAAEDIWYGMSRSSTGDYAKVNYRFKLQRRKLLTYRDKPIIRLTRIGVLQIIFGFLVALVGLLLLLTKRGDIRRFLAQIYFVGAGLAIFGFALYQFVTDAHLLRAENDYILDRREAAENSWGSQKARQKPCGKASWEWTCYCQTLANIFCSRSPIFHENGSQHKPSLLGPMAGQEKTSLCQARIIADLVYMFDEQFTLYCKEEALSERQGIERQVSETIRGYFDGIYELKVSQWADRTFIFDVVSQLIDAYIDAAEGTLVIFDTSIDNLRKYLFLDYLKYLVQHKETDKSGNEVCRFYWICQDHKTPAQVITLRRTKAEEMRQLFPFHALSLLIQRWGKDGFVRSGSDNFWKTYENMIMRYDAKWHPKESCWIRLDETTQEKIKTQRESYVELYQAFFDK